MTMCRDLNSKLKSFIHVNQEWCSCATLKLLLTGVAKDEFKVPHLSWYSLYIYPSCCYDIAMIFLKALCVPCKCHTIIYMNCVCNKLSKYHLLITSIYNSTTPVFYCNGTFTRGISANPSPLLWMGDAIRCRTELWVRRRRVTAVARGRSWKLKKYQLLFRLALRQALMLTPLVNAG